jgi:hypothetical protein
MAVHKVLVVFTYRTMPHILEEGGSQAWSLRPANARKCDYLVCTRNKYQPNSGPETHHSAFLVGKISGVEVSPERSDRWLVRISEYAEVSVPDVWPGARNPVWYVEDLETLGIQPDELEWKPMPEPTTSTSAPATGPDEGDDVSVDDLKAAVAAAHGVPVENIEIIIRL